MRTFLTLLGREIKGYFYSPIAYVVMFFFLIATGFNFHTSVTILNRQPALEMTVIQVVFTIMLFWISMLLIFPMITMRTYADEYRMGTFETLTTAPVEDWQVVLSKFAGSFTFYCILWLPSIAYLVAFHWVTGKDAAMSPGSYAGSYLMLFLIGMFWCSIGCLASSVTTEQINAAIISFVLIFGFFVFGYFGVIAKITEPSILDFISYFSTAAHMDDFSKGIIDTRPIVWYVSMTALMLFINFQTFQYRKWRS